MTDKSCIEKRVAREILSMIEKIYFSEEYAKYRIDYGSKGTRDLLINSMERSIVLLSHYVLTAGKSFFTGKKKKVKMNLLKCQKIGAN